MPLTSYAHGGTLMPKPTLFVVTDELQQVLDNFPADERRGSSLEPLKAFILRWRREGRTYRRICQILRDECHVKVAYGTLHEFVQRRSKSRKPKPEIDIEPEATQPVNSSSAAVSSGKRLTPEERAAQVAYIRSLNKPAVAEEKPKLLFDFDPDKPRTNQPKKEESNGNNSSSN